MAEIYLGVDAGGTKCSARLTDASGNILGQGLSGPANVRIGIEQTFCVIEEAYTQAITEAKLDASAIASIHAGMGVAGIRREGAKEALLAQPFPFDKVKCTSDVIIANMGAHSGRDGGTVIVGTGSIATGRIDGKNINIGGYGFPVSDEGSGAHIGFHAIRMMLSAMDGRIEPTQLTIDISRRFNDDIQEVVTFMDEASPGDYAALAPLVVKAAEVGDDAGHAILQEAAGHIDVLIQSLLRAGVPRCALSGGLAKPIKSWLPPDTLAQLVEPDGDALDGALLLARL